MSPFWPGKPADFQTDFDPLLLLFTQDEKMHLKITFCEGFKLQKFDLHASAVLSKGQWETRRPDALKTQTRPSGSAVLPTRLFIGSKKDHRLVGSLDAPQSPRTTHPQTQENYLLPQGCIFQTTVTSITTMKCFHILVPRIFFHIFTHTLT